MQVLNIKQEITYNQHACINHLTYTIWIKYWETGNVNIQFCTSCSWVGKRPFKLSYRWTFYYKMEECWSKIL